MLDKLKERLLETAGSEIESSVHDMPVDFVKALHSTVEHNYNLELSLLACASSLWCGADEWTGMPAAVGSLLMRAGVAAHLETSGLPDVISTMPVPELGDETLSILVGDGLIAKAMEYLAASCGRHSTRMVEEAARALGASGVLSGISLAVDRFNGIELVSPDGRADYELYSGQLARFASQGGALLAGASGMMLDDAAQIGLLTGRARYLSILAEGVHERDRKSELVFQARTLTDEAQSIAGRRESSSLFTSLMYLSDFL